MVYVGTSGYSYPEWRGTFYPERFPPARMLPYYAERFRTVELNNTFYRMPTGKTVAAWTQDTPAEFVFALKVPQRITHFARLRDVAEPFRYLLDTVGGLGVKLGPLLLQLPPTFRKDAGRLGDCLALGPPSVRMAVEFRHPSWLDEEVYGILRDRNAALCVADTEESTTPVVVTADFGYLRLRDRAYGPDELAQWARTAARAEWRDAFVFFKHEESGTGPALATAAAGAPGCSARSLAPARWPAGGVAMTWLVFLSAGARRSAADVGSPPPAAGRQFLWRLPGGRCRARSALAPDVLEQRVVDQGLVVGSTTNLPCTSRTQACSMPWRECYSNGLRPSRVPRSASGPSSRRCSSPCIRCGGAPSPGSGAAGNHVAILRPAAVLAYLRATTVDTGRRRA